jgi:hypothetical protein
MATHTTCNQPSQDVIGASFHRAPKQTGLFGLFSLFCWFGLKMKETK